MKISLTYFPALQKCGHRQIQSKPHPCCQPIFSKLNYRHRALPPTQLIHKKRNFRGSLIIKIPLRCNVTILLCRHDVLRVPYEGHGLTKLSAIKKHIVDYQAITHGDAALNAPNKNNALHTFSCWQRPAHVV